MKKASPKCAHKKAVPKGRLFAFNNSEITHHHMLCVSDALAARWQSETDTKHLHEEPALG